MWRAADIANKEADANDVEAAAERAKKKDEARAAEEAQAAEDAANGKEFSEDDKIQREKAKKKAEDKEAREQRARDAVKAKREKPVMKTIKVPKTVRLLVVYKARGKASTAHVFFLFMKTVGKQAHSARVPTFLT